MGLRFGDIFQRNVFLLVLDVEQDRVPLVEGAAATVLPAQADWSAVLDQTGEGESFRHPVVHWTFAGAHFRALLEQLLYFGMNVKVRGIRSQPLGELMQLLKRHSSFYFVLRLVTAPKECVPIIRQLPQAGFFPQTAGALL